MRHPGSCVLLLVAALAGSPACGPAGSDASIPEPVTLRPEETFQWSAQPIRFALPPDGWRREITNQGGLLGAGFVKEGSVGEVIEIAEYTALAERSRCKEYQDILERFNSFDAGEFVRATHLARLFLSPPINRQEKLVEQQANETLELARAAFRGGDRDAARIQLEIAARQADRLHYDLNEVVDRVLFAPKNLPRYIQVDVGEPEPAEFQGRPALRQSYTLQDSDRVFAGRRLYFLHGPHLFVAAFQGLDENVPLFEQILETVTFPPRDCRP